MPTRKRFRVVVWSMLALVTLVVLSVVWSAWQIHLDEVAFEREKSAGLRATPPGAAGFDLRSLWAQQPGIIRGIAGLITPSSPVPPGSPPMRLVIGRQTQQTEAVAFNAEAYESVADNPFIEVAVDPRATFSIDVDSASYANIRRFINEGKRPPKDAVRIEEMINYFRYEYPQSSGLNPIAILPEVASAPWQPEHRLVRVGIKARDIDMSRRPTCNLVFLIDVSGSMDEPAKLPLLKSAMKLLVENLRADDRVALVVYAGAEGLVLPSTSGDQKSVLLDAIDSLSPGGSTNGSAGIQLAYDIGAKNFIASGINRVVLATDGDFNVGITNQDDLVRFIEEKAMSGVFLSVLGFGRDNIKDSTLEKLADKGNGNYAYIDTINEARKVLVEELGGTLVTQAKDVKVQIEFNAAEVHSYRLIGYENRILNRQDFDDDAKDAGDMGSGQTVTAVFEIVPAGAGTGQLLNIKLRYKDPSSDMSQLMEVSVVDANKAFYAATEDFRFAAAVASFGMILRDSPYKGTSTLSDVIRIAEMSVGQNTNTYRKEFIELAKRLRQIQ